MISFQETYTKDNLCYPKTRKAKNGIMVVTPRQLSSMTKKTMKIFKKAKKETATY